ncbi:formylglycine-generating enzyme family protein [Pseudoluteimonas lycopersici]|nr:formylglycine-generating enzyme family protein [Lysobacter lycopersici]
MRAKPAIVAIFFALAACGRVPEPSQAVGAAAGAKAPRGSGEVTIAGDDSIAAMLTWAPPAVEIDDGNLAAQRRKAARALAKGRLFEDADAAIPIDLAILHLHADDAQARDNLRRSVSKLLAKGDAALAKADEDFGALRDAHQVAAVARVSASGTKDVEAYLARVDIADQAWDFNRQAEADLAAGRFGVQGGGALGGFREALRLRPKQERATRGIAAVESGVIGRAEEAAAKGDFTGAWRWLGLAASVRTDSPAIAAARIRLEQVQTDTIARLRDQAMAVLPAVDGVAKARGLLAEILRIAPAGDPVAGDLRVEIERVSHYGRFHDAGQSFSDAMEVGGRGPDMVVVPHGGFRMGAAANEEDASNSEMPRHYVRFERGFAMARTETTVAQFGQFVAATNYRTRADKRGVSLAYDAHSGNFAFRNNVDWRSDYAGNPAAPDLPVVHVSAGDAEAYAKWLSQQTGAHYRLPSESEFEYASRAGGEARYPWGDGPPTRSTANVTGGLDVSPQGRRWSNAFAGVADGYWGPAPIGRFRANAFGLHDMDGNVSEWVGDCWHDGYRRAPANGEAWLNPGCRTRVVRGGSWSSGPAQCRSAWRTPAPVDTTNAHIGFRLVRDL